LATIVPVPLAISIPTLITCLVCAVT
jgi:hypothetical protein